jgi:site-specific recombinase XerD
MLEGIYSDARTIERFRRSWLGEWISEYLVGLATQRYAKITLQGYARMLYRFGVFVEEQGVGEIARVPDWIAPFIALFKSHRCFYINWRSLLERFISHLREKDLMLKPEPSRPVGQFVALVSEYVDFLSKNRGLSDDRAVHIRSFCSRFLEYVSALGVRSLRKVSPQVIQSYIVSEGRHYTRSTMSDRCSMLRRFLSYLYVHGELGMDLSSVVVGPRLYRHERCPRFLTRSQIEVVLSSVDRKTPMGRRDYAMLLFLSTYGLRGVEVVRLRLEDIDWRNERLYIRSRKAGNSTVYPLASSVGEALLSYMESGRPETAHRELFLSSTAPFGPFGRTSALGHIVKKYLALSKVTVERPGTHTFRYSCAQRLFEDGFPIKTIGDYLGHRSADSTQRYTMIAISALRDVALGDGEDLS